MAGLVNIGGVSLSVKAVDNLVRRRRDVRTSLSHSPQTDVEPLELAS